MTITDEIAALFRKCRSVLGAPLVEVELTDENMCDILSLCIDDYTEKVQNWIIENNWANLYGKNLSNTDLAFAFSVRTMDLTKDFTRWFSKSVGLQQNGPWELKKDFITIERGKQNYILPAGREINSVLYCNPPSTTAALFANYGGLSVPGMAGGYGMVGGNYGPVGGFYIAQAMDVAYLATDLTYKNRLLRGDLTYKVTAGPEGTRILHLFSTPGSKLTFGAANNALGLISMVGCEVWYTYYDANPGNVDECRRVNSDVILTPDQIPLDQIDFSLLNGPAKTVVRKLFIAKCKETLAMVRGKFSGKVNIMKAEAQLDYNMLLSQSKDEYEGAMKDLTDRLERMSPYNVMKQQAELTDNLAKVLSGKPLKMIVV